MKNKYQRPKARKSWGLLSPVTRVLGSKKAYNRAKEKQRFSVEYID